MLKTLESIESKTRPGKGGVGVGGNSGENGGHNDSSSCSGDFDKKFYPRLQYDSRATHLDA